MRKIPSKLQNWNWGAFLLAPFWSLGNRVWLGLFCWMPWIVIVTALIIFRSSYYKSLGALALEICVILRPIITLIYFIVAFFLGWQGNRRSWQNDLWHSIKEFKIYQRYWTVVGIVLGFPFICITWYLWDRLIDWMYVQVNQILY